MQQRFQYRHYIASNDGISDEQWIINDLEGSIRGLIEVLYQNLPGGTEKTTENSVRIKGVRPKFEPSIYRIQVQSVTSRSDCSFESIVIKQYK
jgi:hypothetical protein